MKFLILALALAGCACGPAGIPSANGGRDDRAAAAPGPTPTPAPDPDRPWLDVIDNGDGTTTTTVDDSCMRGCKPPRPGGGT